MKSKKIIIKSFKIDDNYLVINDKNENGFFIETKYGSVNISIRTDEDVDVGIQYLDIGDMIKIYYEKKNSNKIIIKKINIKTKYKFDSESSDDFSYLV